MLTLDPDSLDQIRDLDPDGSAGVVAEIATTFIETSTQLVADLRLAGETGDADGAMRASHTLKSSSGFLGAKAFADVCREIEQLTRTGNVAGALPFIDRIVVDHPLLCAVLRRDLLGVTTAI